MHCCFCKEWILPYSSLYLSQPITQCLVNGRYSLNADSIDALFFFFFGYEEAKINSTISEIRCKYYENTSPLTTGHSRSFIHSTNTCWASPVWLAQVNMLRIKQWNSEQDRNSSCPQEAYSLSEKTDIKLMIDHRNFLNCLFYLYPGARTLLVYKKLDNQKEKWG